ncbi:MAG: hypothetical protein EOM07_05145 [Clostridia bacterium]|nr:hypothetical protein [Clostridia bacterium]
MMNEKKWFFCFGHGKSQDGRYNDVGTASHDGYAERDILRDLLMPALKKYAKIAEKEGFTFHFYKYNAYRDVILKTIATDFNVVEFHMDGSVNARVAGGHVIIHKDYQPDDYDLKFREMIRNFFGLRSNTNIAPGINGRDNLQNVNIAKKRKINYRLLELGHLTNVHNYNVMKAQADKIALEIIDICCKGKVILEAPPVKEEDKPIYRVQVGAFSVYENAERQLEIAKRHFPDAFIYPKATEPEV